MYTDNYSLAVQSVQVHTLAYLLTACLQEHMLEMVCRIQHEWISHSIH